MSGKKKSQSLVLNREFIGIEFLMGEETVMYIPT